MPRYNLTDSADTNVIHDSLRARYSDAEWLEVSNGGVAREAFIAYCASRNYPTLGFLHDGKPIGGMLFDGEVVHLEVLPEHHGRWGFLWKDALAWALSMKDPFQVGIHATNEKCLRFMDRNNWPRIAADDKFITYEVSSKAPPHHAGRRGRKRAAG